MTTIYIVQHGEKEATPGDPGLTLQGVAQADSVAEFLGRVELSRVFASPLRRARQTAAPIARIAGLAVEIDQRLTERVNWDGTQDFEDFLVDWRHTTEDRNFVPTSGRSSRHTGDQFTAFVKELVDEGGAVAVASHGGATTDLLRTLMGDHAIPSSLLSQGVPSGAITTLTDLDVVQIASVAHLNP